MNSLFDPTEQLQIICSSPDEFHQKAVGWDINHIQLAAGNYRVSIDLVHTLNIQFSNVTRNVGVNERGGLPPGACAIALPTFLGSDPLYYCGGLLEKNECLALKPGDDFEAFSSGAMNYITIVIDSNLLNQEAIRLIGKPFASLVQSHRVRISEHDQLRLRQTISTAMVELRKHPLQLPTMQQLLLEKQIIEQLLLSIQSPAGEKIKVPNRRQVAWKAEQLIRQYPQQNLDIKQLCNIIGCSARTLHLGFQERYGLTPRQYNRILTLNIVRHKLCHSRPEESISTIAMDWGFYHLGHFSQQYKQLFSELPSVTIKRCRESIR